MRTPAARVDNDAPAAVLLDRSTSFRPAGAMAWYGYWPEYDVEEVVPPPGLEDPWAVQWRTRCWVGCETKTRDLIAAYGPIHDLDLLWPAGSPEQVGEVAVRVEGHLSPAALPAFRDAIAWKLLSSTGIKRADFIAAIERPFGPSLARRATLMQAATKVLDDAGLQRWR